MRRFGRKFALIAGLMTVATLGASASADALLITYNFKSVLGATDPYGTGSFSFDDSLIASPLPKTVTQANLNSFSYSDLLAGSFTLANLGSLNFTLGTTPTTSLFAFTTQSADGLRSFTGGAVDANNVGGLSSSVNFLVPPVITNPTLRFPVLAVAAVPEPATLVLLASGVAGLVAVRRRRRQARG